MGRNVMTRILGALLATAWSLLVLVCMGFAGAYQYLAPDIPEASCRCGSIRATAS